MTSGVKTHDDSARAHRINDCEEATRENDGKCTKDASFVNRPTPMGRNTNQNNQDSRNQWFDHDHRIHISGFIPVNVVIAYIVI